eukprot:5396310-Karenia_brevis.AAC.1
MGARMLRAVATNRPPAYMKCQGWPCPNNNPTLGVTLEYQTTPARDTSVADRVWTEDPVKTDTPPPPPP